MSIAKISKLRFQTSKSATSNITIDKLVQHNYELPTFQTLVS